MKKWLDLPHQFILHIPLILVVVQGCRGRLLVNKMIVYRLKIRQLGAAKMSGGNTFRGATDTILRQLQIVAGIPGLA